MAGKSDKMTAAEETAHYSGIERRMQARRFIPKLGTYASPQYARESFAIMKMIGSCTRQQYLEAMADMDGIYPGRGWREQMDLLERHFFENGLPLKGILGGQSTLLNTLIAKIGG